MNSLNKILNIARLTFSIEIKTLQRIQEQLDSDFLEVVKCLSEMEGRVVITGLGKSAIIAQKIVATFNSTGTSALFMHAADALHGDLGMLNEKDVLLCLSKSGETTEFKVLIPMAKQFGNRIIALTSNKDSYLAKAADFFIHIPIEKEADPNNLAPTASSTAQMVVGDAIAMCLLQLKGFTPNDFSKFHPGGSLGKQLYLRVADLFPRNAQPSVRVNDYLNKIIVSMTSGRLGMTVVVNESHQPIGVVTDGDLRRMLEQNENIKGVTAKEIMTPNPKTIEVNSLAVDALKMIRENSISQLIVVEEEKYKGVIHLHDLINEGII